MANSHRPTLGATRARQGLKSGNIIWVLVVGLALVILGFLATYAWKSGDFSAATKPHVTQPAAVSDFKAPPPSAASRQNYQEGAPIAPKGGNPSNPPS